MKYCRKCRLSVNTDSGYCPLCASELAPDKEGKASDSPGKACETGEAGSDNIYPRPDGSRKYNLVFRLFLFLTIVVVSTCLLINILSYSGILWSLVVIGAVQLMWAAIAYPLMAWRNIGYMITVDAVSVCVLLVIIQTVTRTQGWGLDYVIPFLFIAATTVISFVILFRRMKWREYSLYQFIMIILGLLPLVSVISGMVKAIWPSVLSAFYSLLTFTGMFIFADKKYKSELIKRFHF